MSVQRKAGIFPPEADRKDVGGDSGQCPSWYHPKERGGDLLKTQANKWKHGGKDFCARLSYLQGRMRLPFPAWCAFSKGDLCCKKQLLGFISGEVPLFCLTNQPFCAVWVQWQVTWNLLESYFKPLLWVPNVEEARTWQGRSPPLPCCSQAGPSDSEPLAVPGSHALQFLSLFFFFLFKGFLC